MEHSEDILAFIVCVVPIIVLLLRKIIMLIIKLRCSDKCEGVVRIVEERVSNLLRRGQIIYYARLEYEYKGIKRYSISRFGMTDNIFRTGEKLDVYVNPKCPEDIMDEKSRKYGYEIRWFVFSVLVYISIIAGMMACIVLI